MRIKFDANDELLYEINILEDLLADTFWELEEDQSISDKTWYRLEKEYVLLSQQINKLKQLANF